MLQSATRRQGDCFPNLTPERKIGWMGGGDRYSTNHSTLVQILLSAGAGDRDPVQRAPMTSIQ